MNNQSMGTVETISRNLAALMATDKRLNTIAAVAKAAGVGFGTVQRAKNGDGNITVQNLELIAHAFRRTSVELLLEQNVGYAVETTPTILQVTEAPADERALIAGYRDASEEVKEIMLDLARKASKKNDCAKIHEGND